ncbi:MAG: 1-acyl-sn-glycerol-3-phosphate acyltransferase [bacterium]
MKEQDRERAVVEVVSRVVEGVRLEAEANDLSVEDVLADTLFFERQRLDTSRRTRDSAKERSFYRIMNRRLPRAAVTEQIDLLRQATERFTREVVGRFDPRVYAFTTKLLPIGAGLVVNAVSPISLLSRLPDLPRLQDQVVIRGATEELKALAERGTIILAPTHLSNLDSIILGFSLYLLGLPPFTYGAGLNLFTNPLISFFMHNLGAYKVDRRKKAALYKRVLKEYATVSMEYGYHNLFFPGGTRSRSGEVESRLKLGLLGCGLQAYINNLRLRVPKPDIFIVPCTLGYGLVLEAATLIDDHLQEAGKSRYIIEDDEFSRPRQVFNFIRELISLDARIVLNISEPLDPFGNRVLSDGTSVDSRGRPVDPSRYVVTDTGPDFDPQRDSEYTRESGRAVVRSLHRNATFMSTNLLAFTVFHRLRGKAPNRNLFRFLRTADELGGIPLDEVYPALERLRDGIQHLSEQGELSPASVPFGFDPQTVLADGLKYFGTYHTHEVIQRRGDRLFPGDMKLLYYYRNRLAGYGLEATINPPGRGVS